MRSTINGKLLLVSIVLLLLTSAQVFAGKKREFRGAWIQCVNGQFEGLGTQAMQQNLLHQLDELQKDGINAIIFQVRPECDALYQSKLEPWSRFLTGRQGVAPSPYWDPLQWMIDQCHKRGMELHAWINPFRAKTKGTSELAINHVALLHPDRVIPYDGQFILNPALKENRDYVCEVVKDIVSRYDVDGIHIDDYFYPYPVAGQQFDDDRLYEKDKQGLSKSDWRRHNVDVFIQQLSNTIHQTKPWVKFGVSPFGIYRNKSTDANVGSNTRGLQNYDDLYADILLWVNNGWVDYCVPQLYWQIGHKTADYAELIKWWNRYASARPLFIGEDVERTVKYPDLQNPQTNQMAAKYRLHDEMPHVDGTVLWYSRVVVDNLGCYGSLLRSYYWKKPALQPLMPFIDNKSPKKPKKLKVIQTSDGPVLFWTKPKGCGWKDEARQYVVYRFEEKEKVDFEDASHIVGITSDTFVKLPVVDGTHTYYYYVTSLDRMSNESKASKKKAKL